MHFWQVPKNLYRRKIKTFIVSIYVNSGYGDCVSKSWTIIIPIFYMKMVDILNLKKYIFYCNMASKVVST